ncbi:MAG: ATP-grasp domain-containing protein, partial [Spartobacteria bacterium]|nr:ATP-grasp domain-containing protein [Spartobacteria bacterium]
SIVRCTNKVYLAELMQRHRIRIPKTLIIHRDNVQRILEELSLPCILKQPDSSFSAGVVKAETVEEVATKSQMLLDKSELIIAQEYLPTDYDWRVGILDHKPLYVCKYFMADRHWQIVNHRGAGKIQEGPVEAVPIDEAPYGVVSTALRAANLIGHSLYGVDLKLIKNKCYVIEVNDNPSIEAGYEDMLLKNDLYDNIMRVFRDRIEKAH